MKRLLPDFYRPADATIRPDRRPPKSQQRAAQPARAGHHRRQTACGATACWTPCPQAAASSSSPRTTRTPGSPRSTTSGWRWARCSRSAPRGPTGCRADHPMAGHLDVYQWLTVLQEYLVLGLMGKPHRDEPAIDHRCRAASSSATITGSTPTRRSAPAGPAAPPSCWPRRARSAAVDVRGGAPGTRETDLLDPANSVRHVDAVVLTGGSAYGLAAADGVMRWLEEHDRGVAMDGRPGADRAGRGDLRPAGRRLEVPARRPSSAMRPPRPPATGRRRRDRRRRASARAPACSRAASARRRPTLTSGVTVGALVVVNCRRQRRRPGHRAAVDGGSDRRVRPGRAAAPTQIAAFADLRRRASAR